MINASSDEQEGFLPTSPTSPTAMHSGASRRASVVIAVAFAGLLGALCLFVVAPDSVARGGRDHFLQLDGGCGSTCGKHSSEVLSQKTWVELVKDPSMNNASLLEAYLHAAFDLNYNCSKPVRLPGPVIPGTTADGGYVMCDDPVVNWQANKCTLLSFGIASDDTFETAIAERYGCEVHEFDPTVNWSRGEYNTKNLSIHFHKLGCWSHETNLSIGPVDSIVNLYNRYYKHGNSFNLKIDVEGAEWETLPAIPDWLLDKTDNLILEIHTTVAPRSMFNPTAHLFEPPTMNMVKSLARIREKFYLYHWHVNNCCTPTPLGTDYNVPIWDMSDYTDAQAAAAAPGAIPLGHDHLVIPAVPPGHPWPKSIYSGPAPLLPDGASVPPGLAVPGPIELSFLRKSLVPGTPQGPFYPREDLNGANNVSLPLIDHARFPNFAWDRSYNKNWKMYKQ